MVAVANSPCLVPEKKKLALGHWGGFMIELITCKILSPLFKESWTGVIEIAWAPRAVCQNDALHPHESEQDVLVRSWAKEPMDCRLRSYRSCNVSVRRRIA